MEEEVSEAHIPPCIVDMDGKECDLNPKDIMPDSEKEFESELRMTVFGKENEAWEESCLSKFSEFLGFSVKGHEEEIVFFCKESIGIKGADGFYQVRKGTKRVGMFN